MSSQPGGERRDRVADGLPRLPGGDDESSLQHQRRSRRQMFERIELAEMRQERRVLMGQALTWAAAVVVPAAVIGLGLGYVLDPLSARLSPGWVPPPGFVCLLLGAVCGSLGAATAGLLYHSVFHEEQDMPVVIVGVATLVAIAGGVHGAGRGSVWATAAGLAAAVPVGIIAGIATLILYSALKWLYGWGRKEISGY